MDGSRMDHRLSLGGYGTQPLQQIIISQPPIPKETTHPQHQIRISPMLTALVPWSWVWRTPKWSVFPYDIVYLLHRMFGWFDIPADPTIWPFG